VQPEKLSLDDQVMLFAGADVIVAEFGAAMANVVFCRPGVKIVEIIPEGQFDTWSANLCAAYELEHVVLFQPNNREPRDPVDNDFSYVVDIAAVTGILSALSI
jgi:capsular polysaccharide biosynthesis protein